MDDSWQLITPLLPSDPENSGRTHLQHRSRTRCRRTTAGAVSAAAAVVLGALLLVALTSNSDGGLRDRVVFEAGGLHIELYGGTYTVAMMNVSVSSATSTWGRANNFSFVPETHAPRRGCFNLGDVTFRARPLPLFSLTPSRAWAYYTTAAADGSKPAPPVKATGTIAAHDVTPLVEQDVSHALPAFGNSSPLRVVRSWRTVSSPAVPGTEYLIMQVNLTNRYHHHIEIGGLGLAMPAVGMPVVNLTDIHQAVWEDPHIGLDHGWVEFVRLIDGEETLLALPSRENGHRSPFEAWRPVMENTCGNAVWELCTHSKAWAEDWASTTQFPFLEMADFLRDTGMWPNPKTPWPAWHGHESVPVTDSTRFSAPFNEPTSAVLPPEETLSIGIKFVLSSAGPRSREAALREEGSTAILRAVPGYVLSPRMRSASLFVLPPIGVELLGATSSDDAVLAARVLPGSDAERWVEVEVVVRVGVGVGDADGGGTRASILLSFSDGSVASAHYGVVAAGGFAEAVEALGAHWEHEAWLPRDFFDPFGRGASVMPYDRQDRCRVLQDSRAYDVGLSDDAGGGNPLGFASMVAFSPTAGACSRISEFIRYTLQGTKEGLRECSCGGMPCDCQLPPFKSLQIRPEDVRAGVSSDLDGVRMTMFYYYNDPLHPDDPLDFRNDTSGHFPYDYAEVSKCPPLPGMEGGPNWCMTEALSNATYRIYNLPHHTASYYSMYRAARNHDGLRDVLDEDWEWYLMRSANTTIRFGAPAVGVMDGTVFKLVLDAVREEQRDAAARSDGGGAAVWRDVGDRIEANMRARATAFSELELPYTASEYSFDTVSQEEVVVWLLHFADENEEYLGRANRTVAHVLSYMRSSPTWPYHGGSRSWGDLGNNGKWMASAGSGFETRGNFHYRAGLNSIPLLEWYRRFPDELFVLEVGLGAVAGTLMNVDGRGAPSMMLHMLPHVLDYDPRSGDFGLGFFGHSLEAAAYLVFDEANFLVPRWLCYLCDFLGPKPTALTAPVSIAPRDSYMQRVFLEPLALYIVLDTGAFAAVRLDLGSRRISIEFLPAEPSGSFRVRRVRLQKTAPAATRPGTGFTPLGMSESDMVRGAFEFPSNVTAVEVGFVA